MGRGLWGGGPWGGALRRGLGEGPWGGGCGEGAVERWPMGRVHVVQALYHMLFDPGPIV